MALGITLRSHTDTGTTAATTHTSSSFTPSANCKLVGFSAASNDAHSTAQNWGVTDTATLSWTEEYEAPQTSWNGTAAFGGKVVLWTADVGGSPSSMTVTVDPWSGGEDGYISLVVFEVTGTSVQIRNPGTPQLVGNIAEKGGGSAESHTSGTLGAAVTSGNLAVACFGGADGGLAGTITDWTALSRQAAGDLSNVNVYYRTDFTGTSVTLTDCGTDIGFYGAVLLEFEEGGGSSESEVMFLRPVTSGIRLG